MTNYIFVQHLKGVSKKNDRPYNFVKISDGLNTYTLSNPNDVDFSSFKTGNEIDIDFEVKANYNQTALEPVIVSVA